MKKLILAVFLMAISSSSFAVDLIIGGWSTHGDQDQYDDLNTTHDALGFILDNGFTAFTFNNSFYEQSYVLGYTKKFKQYNHEKYNISTSIVMGVVHGYTKVQADVSYIGGDLALYLLPTITVGYGKFKMDTGFTIAFDKPLITNSFRYEF